MRSRRARCCGPPPRPTTSRTPSPGWPAARAGTAPVFAWADANRSALLPANLDALRGSERLAQQPEQMVGRLAVLANHVERVGRDVVILVFARFLFERIHEHFQVLLRDLSEQYVGIGVVEVNRHRFLILAGRARAGVAFA